MNRFFDLFPAATPLARFHAFCLPPMDPDNQVALTFLHNTWHSCYFSAAALLLPIGREVV